MSIKYKNIIFDGSNAVHRISAANPPLSTRSGIRTEVTFGLLRLLSHVCQLNPAERCFVIMDGKGSRQIRRDIDPEYKAHRGADFTKADEARIASMYKQVDEFWEAFGKHLPIVWMVSEKYEADDIMAMIANTQANLQQHSLIVSGDKDLLQLVHQYTSVYSPNRNEHCNVANFTQYTKGYPTPQAFLYGKCLQGDSGDHVPGIPGCGEVWALKILEEHNWNIADVLQTPTERFAKSKLGKAVLCSIGRDRIKKNYKLMSLLGHKVVRTQDIEIRYGHLDRGALKLNMAKFQFASLLASFNQFITPFLNFERTRNEGKET